MLPNVSAIYRDLAFMANPNMSQKISDYQNSTSHQNLFN